ncbi:MAG: PilZ domain-containing protein [Planctomycetota bacterium]
MLDIDYSDQCKRLIRSVPWDIELPSDWENFFQERGETPAWPCDERSHRRLRVRTHGVLWFTQGLSFVPRGTDPIGVYTKDFSKQGCGFIAPLQIFPMEEVRIVLPAFWVTLRVMRARRVANKCFEIGCELIARCDLDERAFETPEPKLLTTAS